MAFDPAHARAIACRARVRQALGDPAGAREDLLWLAENAPSGYPDALLRLADLAIEAGDVTAAQAFVDRYRAVGPPQTARIEAERRLGEIASRPAITALRTSPDDAVRLRAIRRLRGARSRSGIGALIEALEDPNLRLRHYAWSVLRELTGESFGPSPGEWRRWWADRGGVVGPPDRGPTPPEGGA